MIVDNPSRELARSALETRWEDLLPSPIRETKLVLADSIAALWLL